MHFPITDSHLHLWDNHHLNYPHLMNMPRLNRAYLLSDLMEATKSLHLESFIFVQSGCDEAQSLAEVNWVTALAERDARIHGIIAYASLELGNEIRSYLETLKNNALVKGVRRVLIDKTNDFCFQEKFLEGIQLLAEFRLSFEICIRSHQLPAVIHMVEECPEVKFVLEHSGHPNRGAKEWDIWQKHMSEVARFPNVWCKLSGLITEDTQNWGSDHLKPYIYHVIQEFSYDRVMFGSGWPVVNMASSYAHWVHTLYDVLIHHEAHPDQLKKLFYENARRYYALQNEMIEIDKI